MERYDIAFSYAKEQNDIIKVYKDKLAKLGLNIFIDTEHPELFVFKHVPETLKAIYDNEQIVMLVFLSKEYVKKEFTKYEGRIAFDRLLKDKRLAIIKIDDVDLPWLPSSLFYYDIRKYTIDIICQSLYTAIKGENIPDIKDTYEDIKKYFIEECNEFDVIYNFESCTLLNIKSKKSNFIKVIYNEEFKNILFFHNSNKIAEMAFPIVEIYKDGNSYIFCNKGITDSGDLMCKFMREEDLLHDVITKTKIFLRNLND